ncbi:MULTISPECIES: hypothetical protein [Desulfitobacterium]|uniref:Uncharacterized protein n=1 Tax=Desulfitobacterium dehalogenans (strain ATCC 51507 / DSM 9161 / JW/IU-DC1) TaxID=756499 RepID=I4AAS2_DESDJ|nr:MULTISPECIES: hypothetical protein [Desulfitobacterium]AFM01057.1 hypothetical protein Desde_2744 [Desulfitobacterium dehalogenans ATCC 51507]
MDDDPLPAHAVPYDNVFARIEQGKTKQYVAVFLCLFLGLALALCPYVAFEQPQTGLWILKYNSSINQAPRAVIFGALAVLPEKIDLDSVPLPQMWEINRGTTEDPVQKLKHWIVMVWYGSTYVYTD